MLLMEGLHAVLSPLCQRQTAQARSQGPSYCGSKHMYFQWVTTDPKELETTYTTDATIQ
jgi:hypothetical protein